MIFRKASFFTVCLLFVMQSTSFAQEQHYYQTDFSIVDFQERRSQIFKAIGNNSIALIQGAASIKGFKVFRQTNTFYYLCGLESEHAYLLLNGRTKTSTIYLPNRDKARESSQGKILSVEDADLIKKLTGVERVRGYGSLSNDLVGTGLIK